MFTQDHRTVHTPTGQCGQCPQCFRRAARCISALAGVSFLVLVRSGTEWLPHATKETLSADGLGEEVRRSLTHRPFTGFSTTCLILDVQLVRLLGEPGGQKLLSRGKFHDKVFGRFHTVSQRRSDKQVVVYDGHSDRLISVNHLHLLG